MQNQKHLKNFYSKLEDIGKRLKTVRERLGFTLEQMNRETGISKSYISDFERGKKIPASKYLFQLCETFNANLNYVFKGKGDMFISADSGKIPQYNFGKYQEEIDDLLFHITNIPNALFAVLQFFSEYKENMDDFINAYLEKHGNTKKVEDGK
jgi:transcriptional regulator with XRE-family HTH domain